MLVPIDFSTEGPVRLETAVALAKRRGSRLTLLHVMLVEHTDVQEFSGFYDELRRNAEARHSFNSLYTSVTGTPTS